RKKPLDAPGQRLFPDETSVQYHAGTRAEENRRRIPAMNPSQLHPCSRNRRLFFLDGTGWGGKSILFRRSPVPPWGKKYGHTPSRREQESQLPDPDRVGSGCAADATERNWKKGLDRVGPKRLPGQQGGV